MSFINLFLAIFIACAIYEINANPIICNACESEEDCNAPPPEKCIWGENTDACGRRVCSKGPGERCGGPRNIIGTCGEGMMCYSKDELCHGCSIQIIQCYNDM